MSNNAPSSQIFTTPAKAAIFGIVIGAVVGVALLMLFQGEEHGSAAAQDSESTSQSKEPLYWVAPMDPNYRKDGPGKSPMGMAGSRYLVVSTSTARDRQPRLGLSDLRLLALMRQPVGYYINKTPSRAPPRAETQTEPQVEVDTMCAKSFQRLECARLQTSWV